MLDFSRTRKRMEAGWKGQIFLTKLLNSRGRLTIVRIRMNESSASPGYTWLAFTMVTVFSWGVYGILLHKGQVAMGDRPRKRRVDAFVREVIGCRAKPRRPRPGDDAHDDQPTEGELPRQGTVDDRGTARWDGETDLHDARIGNGGPPLERMRSWTNARSTN